MLERGQLLEVKAADAGQVEAIIARFGTVDGHGDYYARNAFRHGAPLLIGPCCRHELVKGLADPVGDAQLLVTQADVRIHGRYRMEEPAARAEFERVRAAGDSQEWSYSLKAREGELTSELRAKGARRFLTKVTVFTAEPVTRGACGPACRTVQVKCAGNGSCSCSSPSAAIVKTAEATLAPARATLAVADAHRLLGHLGPPYADPPSGEEDRAARFVVRALHPTWSHRWTLPTHAPTLAGFFMPSHPGRIYLVAHKGRGVEPVVRTVLHELLHAEGDPDEARAEAFADKWLRPMMHAGQLTDWNASRLVVADIGVPELFPPERLPAMGGRVLLTRRTPGVWIYRPWTTTRSWVPAA